MKTRKLRVHCHLRYTKCKDLGCSLDDKPLEHRRLYGRIAIEWCHRYGEFYNQKLEHELYGGWKWIQDKNGEWIRE